MPLPLDIGLSLGEGKNKVDLPKKEGRFLHGVIESPWWTKFSWWVISEGLILLISPWVMLYTGYVPPAWVFALVIAIFAIPPMIVFRKKVPRFAWAIIPAFLVLSLVLALFPSTQAEVTDPPVSPANVEEKVQTQEEASASNTLVNHGEISVSISAPNPASTPPPSPEAEVIKIERRITRGIIPSVPSVQ